MNARLDTGGTRSFLLTNWTTVTGGFSGSSVIQDASEWLDLAGFHDATFHMEVSAVTPPVSGSTGVVQLFIESAPFPDESLFTSVVGPIPCPPGLFIAQTASASGFPLSRYVRWRLQGNLPARWNVTMRIRVMANRSRYFVPPSLSGCVLWLRADRGLSFTNGNVSGWADQSTSRDPGRALTGGTSPPTWTTADSNYGNQPSLSFSGNVNCKFTSPTTWSPSVAQSRTWVFVGHRTSTTGTNTFIDVNGGTGDTANITSTGVITVSSSGGALSLSSGAGQTWGPSGTAVMLESVNPNSSLYTPNSFSSALATGAAGTNAINSLSVGINSAGANPWIGPMAELILYNRLLTTSEKGLLRRYLNTRYGLSIT